MRNSIDTLRKEGEGMTESDKKLLTEKLLNERWEENYITPIYQVPVKDHNRAFTTPDDFFAVFEKLAKKEEYLNLVSKAYGKNFPLRRGNVIVDYIRYLHSKNSEGEWIIAELIAGWLKEKEGKA